MQWSELCKSRGESASQTAIDIDAFDAILMNRASASASNPSDQHLLLSTPAAKPLETTTDEDRTRTSVTEVHHVPARPSRPRSSGSLPTSSRASGFAARISSVSVPVPSCANERQISAHACDEPHVGATDGRTQALALASPSTDDRRSRVEMQMPDAARASARQVADPWHRDVAISSLSEQAAQKQAVDDAASTELSLDELRVLEETLMRS